MTAKQSDGRFVFVAAFVSFVSVSLLMLQVNFWSRIDALRSLAPRSSRLQFRFLPWQSACGVSRDRSLLSHCCPVNGASGATDKDKLMLLLLLMLLLKPMERH